MDSYEKLLDLFSELDDSASFIKLSAIELSNLDDCDDPREQKDINAFIASCVEMNKKLTELIEGKDSAYDISQLAKGESIDG